MRRMTQNAERHNLPTARSAIRMAWVYVGRRTPDSHDSHRRALVPNFRAACAVVRPRCCRAQMSMAGLMNAGCHLCIVTTLSR